MSSIDPHARKIRAAVESGEAARSTLVASWRRCTHVHGLNPEDAPPRLVLSGPELRASAERVEPLFFAGRAAIERLHGTVASSGACILLAGADGVSIRWWGREADADELRRRGVWPGVDWSERHEGTNGIGTCLIEKGPLGVHMEQHFFARDRGISCVAAPLFDHRGALAGALNVTLYGTAAARAWPGLILGAVTDTARQVEIDHFHHMFQAARIVSLPGQARSGAVLLAVDQDDIVLGATRAARLMLGLSEQRLSDGVCARDLLEGEADDLVQAERGALRRMLVRQEGNVSATARALGLSRATMKRKIMRHGLGRKH